MNGRLESAGDQWRLRFTRQLAHSPEKVWRAITEAQHLKAWFPDEIELPSPLQTGARARFTSPYRPEVFETEIIECSPPSVLEFRWDTNDTLRFEVRPDGDGCELTLLDTFDELGKAARDAGRLAHVPRRARRRSRRRSCPGAVRRRLEAIVRALLGAIRTVGVGHRPTRGASIRVNRTL